MPHARVAHVASSAWTPATLLAILVATLQLASGTSPRDLLAFTVYAALALVLPGTLLWRLLRPAAPRLWLEDVVFGAILGYAVEIVCYVAARAVGRTSPGSRLARGGLCDLCAHATWPGGVAT